MKVKIHTRNIDEKMKLALHVLVEHTMKDLLSDRKGLLKNLEIDVHLKHHSHEGCLLYTSQRPRDRQKSGNRG